MTYLARTLAGGLLSAALLTAGTQPAVAAAPGAEGGLPAVSVPASGAASGHWLYLTVTRGDARSSDTRGTLLLCDPPQGHARAARACAELAATDGDIAALPPQDVLCTMVYAPVTVRAVGEWGGRPVDYTHTFANGCEMAARTGDVFALEA
ncbi:MULTISPECIES: SSI family serine proteinase inhibitor [unclassified Streptomyces]|uniref:SSI family serine proteinase inhibitor n=1 Tax=unclassified Streptomyces TaxID=2593676 RepID=UPI0033A2FAC7